MLRAKTERMLMFGRCLLTEDEARVLDDIRSATDGGRSNTKVNLNSESDEEAGGKGGVRYIKGGMCRREVMS